jgi:hypothetical protein
MLFFPTPLFYGFGHYPQTATLGRITIEHRVDSTGSDPRLRSCLRRLGWAEIKLISQTYPLRGVRDTGPGGKQKRHSISSRGSENWAGDSLEDTEQEESLAGEGNPLGGREDAVEHPVLSGGGQMAAEGRHGPGSVRAVALLRGSPGSRCG